MGGLMDLTQGYLAGEITGINGTDLAGIVIEFNEAFQHAEHWIDPDLCACLEEND